MHEIFPIFFHFSFVLGSQDAYLEHKFFLFYTMINFDWTSLPYNRKFALVKLFMTEVHLSNSGC